MSKLHVRAWVYEGRHAMQLQDTVLVLKLEYSKITDTAMKFPYNL